MPNSISSKSDNPSPAASQPMGFESTLKIGIATAFAVLFFWSYWPTLEGLVTTWSSVADYNYGFLVVPIAAFMLWWRRSTRPTVAPGVHVGGLSLILAAAVLRIISGKIFLDAVDGWSIVLWIGGLVWMLGGWQWFRWALPAIVFLFFMVPLPFRVENSLSVPLQRIATSGSAWLLQLLGEPALPEGTKIVLGQEQLEIERACSGLRMFIGVLAFAYVYAVFSHRPWWHKAVLLLGTVPVAIAANMMRITATGVLFQWTSNPSLHSFIHDSAGWMTIVLAAAMLGSLSWYCARAMQATQIVGNRGVLPS